VIVGDAAFTVGPDPEQRRESNLLREGGRHQSSR